MQRNITLLLTLAVVGAVAAVGWLIVGGGVTFTSAGLDRDLEAYDAETRALLGDDARSLRAAPENARNRPEKEDDAEKAPPAPTFEKGEGVFGRVVDGRGAPVEGALVKLTARDARMWWRRLEPDPPPLATATTDAEGTFLVGPAPAERMLQVRAEAAGYAPTVEQVRTRGYRVDLVLDRGGALDVEIKDRKGGAVAGATVLHSVGDHLGMVVTEAVSDERGAASFPNLPTGTGNLLVAAEGYAAVTQAGVGVLPGARETRTVVLPAPMKVHGRVLAAGTQLPLPGARVEARYPYQPWLEDSAAVVADEGGNYEVEVLAPVGNQVTFHVEAGDRPAVSINVQLQEGTEGSMSHDLEVPSDQVSFEGRVLDSLGRPVAGAKVSYPYAYREEDALETRTRSDGSFAIDAPSTARGPNQAVYLVATAPGEGVGTTYARVPKEGEPVQPVEIRLTGTGTVSGRVVDGGGTAVQGALVLLEVDWQLARQGGRNVDWRTMSAIQNPMVTHLEAVTDADGRFRIGDVPPMTYRLTVSAGLDTIIAPEPVEVESGRDASRNVVLGEGLRIEGTVTTPDGRPVPGALVSAYPSRGGPGMEATSKQVSGRSQSDGRFVLHGATDASYRVFAQATGYRAESVNDVEGGRTDVDLVMTALGWIEGRVELDGRGYAGTFTVQARPVKDSGARNRNVNQFNPGMMMGGSANTFSPDDGAFELKNLSAGEYDLSVTTPEGWISAGAVRVRVADGQSSEAVLTLSQGSTVRGRVVSDETGEPLTGVYVHASGRGQDGALPSDSTRTDGEGRYILKGLGSGRYAIRVQPPSGIQFEKFVDLQIGEDRTLDLREERPGAIRTLVVDPTGAAIAGIQIQIQNAAGQAVWPNWQALQREGVTFTANTWNELRQTDEGGVNLWRHLSPGTYQVTVVARPTPDGKRWQADGPVSVTVHPGRTANVTVPVEAVGG